MHALIDFFSTDYGILSALVLATTIGMLVFYKFMTAAGSSFENIGGFEVPTDDRRPLETPRGFKDPAKAMAMLDDVAAAIEKEYGTLNVKWGDVLRFRRGNTDVPGKAAQGVDEPSALKLMQRQSQWRKPSGFAAAFFPG